MSFKVSDNLEIEDNFTEIVSDRGKRGAGCHARRSESQIKQSKQHTSTTIIIEWSLLV